jgi:pimeloyl-ACP methyl ester carboxylesterase
MSSPAARPLTVAVPGGTLTGWEWGPPDGTVVLLLHGFPQRSTAWSGVGERLAEVGLRAVALDQRGYSDGLRPPAVADYALPRLVGDALAAVDALGRPVHLAGHDWGGIVGWHLASRYPQAVRTWTALSTPSPLALAAALAEDPDQRTRLGYIEAFRQPGHAEAALLAGGGARLRAIYGAAVPPDQATEDIAFFSRPGVLSAALNWYRAMSPQDLDGLTRAAIPTSYVWGANDIAFGRTAAERTGAEVVGPYSFVPLEGTGHWLLEEAPDTVAQTISERALGD